MNRTPFKTLESAYNIAKKVGINSVYVGNISHEKGGNTWELSGNSNKSYLKLTMVKDEIETVIENMMLGEF